MSAMTTMTPRKPGAATLLGLAAVLAVAALAPFLARPARAQRTAAASGKPVSLAGGRVTFTPPPGFAAWTKEQIGRKYPPGPNAPQHVWANSERGTISVAVTFSPARISPEELPELKQFLEGFLPRALPGIRWLKREFVTINGTRWVHFAMTSKAIDTTIYNDMYFTSFDGKMLGFNFNSTLALKNKTLPLFARSRDSIVLKPS